MQSLDGAYQRVKRARKHLANLKKRVNALRQVIYDSIVIERKPALFQLPDGRKVKGLLGSARATLVKSPYIITILVGETIYNLRAALDYLIYELAKFDSKQIVEGTQFPIEDSVQGFNSRTGDLSVKRKGVYLRGISDKHIAIIKGLQPCYGCQWTKVLRGISNPDKHRELTIIRRGVGLNIVPGGRAEVIIAGKPVEVKDTISIDIAFSDGTPIIETLEQLHSEITKVLDLFKPEFK